jgi:NAD(P)-dependent dehydrogenase (short-subunit alcohol dehydrogenase family)
VPPPPSSSAPPPALALVVGGSRGIGLAIARRLGTAGHPVVLAGRSATDLAAATDELAAAGIDASSIAADVSQPEGASVICDHVLAGARNRRLVLAYAAGVFGPIGPLGDAGIAEWRSVIETNLLGAFYVTRLLLAPMLAAGWGRIVFVSSKAALGEPGGGAAAYAISKIALNRLAAEVAAEVAGSGVTANSIHPGEVRTAMWAEIRQRSAAARRLGEPLARWAAMVDTTGGDPVSLGAEMVGWLVEHPEVNGEFLLPEEYRRRTSDGSPPSAAGPHPSAGGDGHGAANRRDEPSRQGGRRCD